MNKDFDMETLLMSGDYKRELELELAEKRRQLATELQRLRTTQKQTKQKIFYDAEPV